VRLARAKSNVLSFVQGCSRARRPVRRFEVSKGKYVQVTEEELQSVEVEANNGIEFRELSRSLLREQLLSGTVNKVPRSRQSAFSLGTIPRLQSLHVDDLMTAPLDR
jgi:hypothetical protein